MSSKGIEPFTAINQFFYREPPLPIGSPALLSPKFTITITITYTNPLQN